MTKQQMEEIWRGKIICATHFNYWGSTRNGVGWLRKRWDEGHTQPALGRWLRKMRRKARTGTLRYLAGIR